MSSTERRILYIAGGSLTATLAPLVYFNKIGISDAINIILVSFLVLITAMYVKRTADIAKATKEQAEASVEMAKEMREQRRPIVVQQAIYEKDIWEGSTSNYFSHFEAYNKGNGPAIEVEISLVDSGKRTSIDSHRKSFLGAGEPPIQFCPTSLSARREDSTCYLVCEYQSILSRSSQTWYQTWLPFEPVKSSREGEIIVKAGELEFKEVTEKDRIDAFSSKSKPK